MLQAGECTYIRAYDDNDVEYLRCEFISIATNIVMKDESHFSNYCDRWKITESRKTALIVNEIVRN